MLDNSRFMVERVRMRSIITVAGVWWPLAAPRGGGITADEVAHGHCGRTVKTGEQHHVITVFKRFEAVHEYNNCIVTESCFCYVYMKPYYIYALLEKAK